MGNRKLSVIFTVMALTLFSVSQALAQTPIEGWDKAEFGMSPEEVREAYAEEEQYYKDEYYQKLEYIEKYYSRRPFAGWERALERERNSHGEYEEFWKEGEECWSREGEGIGYPYALSCFWFAPNFSFVDGKLYKIEIYFYETTIRDLHYISDSFLEEDIERNGEKEQKLIRLEDFLIEKYDDYSEKKETKSERQLTVDGIFVAENRRGTKTIAVRTETSIWVDGNGNRITLECGYELFSDEEESYDFLSYYEISYYDKILTELWEKKQEQWKIEVAEWKRKGEELRLKGVDSF